MSEPNNNNESAPKAAGDVVPAKSAGTNPPSAVEQPAAGQLTKEEQWALFEKEMKENDWGHQPC
jgi:hypothetical protein